MYIYILIIHAVLLQVSQLYIYHGLKILPKILWYARVMYDMYVCIFACMCVCTHA